MATVGYPVGLQGSTNTIKILTPSEINYYLNYTNNNSEWCFKLIVAYFKQSCIIIIKNNTTKDILFLIQKKLKKIQ